MQQISSLFQNKRIRILIIVIIVITAVVWVIFQNVKNQLFPDEPLIRAGENIRVSLSALDVTFTFEDPLKTPANVPIYPIYKAPETLFNEKAVVDIAANVGFTNKASAQQTTEGYIYTEAGSTLSFNVTGGTIRYARPKENLPVTTQPISITDALARAKEFVTRIGFENPLYVWSEQNVRLYTLDGDNIMDATFVDNKTQYHITIPMQIGNAPLYLPQQQYIRVHANGDIVGASLWYPMIDLGKGELLEIIDYPDATSKIRIGEILYQIGSFTSQTVFTTSAVGYVVPDGFFYQADRGGFITEPVYIFSNDNVTVYVGAKE